MSRHHLPEICPYLGWTDMRLERGMSADEVERIWRARRERARRAGYAPRDKYPKKRAAAWLNSGVDNPFQCEHAFVLRLGLALKGLRRPEAAAA